MDLFLVALIAVTLFALLWFLDINQGPVNKAVTFLGQEAYMHFSWSGFGHIAATIAPIALQMVGVPAPLTALIAMQIQNAEALPNATGPEKKQYVLDSTAAAIAAVNSVRPGTFDPNIVHVVDTGIDTAVGAINAASRFKSAPPATPPTA